MNAPIANAEVAMEPKSKVKKIASLLVAAAAFVGGAIQFVGGINSFIPDQGKPSSPMTVENAKLTTEHAKDVGKYSERGNNIIRTGTGFFIYFETKNLSTTFSDGNVKSSISVDVLIQNAAGTAVVGQDNAWQIPFTVASSQHRSIHRAWSSLEVPGLNLPDGRYTMTLRVHDEVARTHADQKIELEYAQNPSVASLPANTLR